MDKQNGAGESSDDHRNAHMAFWRQLVDLSNTFMNETSLGLECVFDELIDLATKAAVDIGLTKEQFLEGCGDSFDGIQQEASERAQKETEG